MVKLAWRNTWRHPGRAGLTVLGMAVAVLAFCLLRTVVAAWYAGVTAASPTRLVTRNQVSLVYRLPLAYCTRIEAVPGVTQVTNGCWVGGTYISEKNFFPQVAVHLPSYLEIYPEYVIPPDQKRLLFQDRRGCVVGRSLAQRFGWRLGDAITIRGTVYPGDYALIIRAIYTGLYPTTDEGRLYFHWEYLNETVKKTLPDRANQVGWYITQVANPDLAGPVATEIDALFQNSLAETLTESEAAFRMGIISMTEAILMAIQVVSWVVIGVILVVLTNTMAMNARERRGEYAVLKTMGFGPGHLAGLILAESMFLALAGGLLGLMMTFPAVQAFRKALGHYFRIFPLTNQTLALGLAAALAVGVLAALVPAWQASRVAIAENLGKVE